MATGQLETLKYIVSLSRFLFKSYPYKGHALQGGYKILINATCYKNRRENCGGKHEYGATREIKGEVRGLLRIIHGQ